MFIANRLVPQHKDFLDEHGYEFREFPENDFDRRLAECETRAQVQLLDHFETVTTPGVLSPNTCELLYKLETQKMTLCYKMLLLMLMTEFADTNGRAPLSLLALHFRQFFLARSMQNKLEENPNRVDPGTLSRRTDREWQRVIRDQPVRYLTSDFLIDEGTTIRWAPSIWNQWSPQLAQELRTASLDRMIRYFNRHVPGGY